MPSMNTLTRKLFVLAMMSAALQAHAQIERSIGLAHSEDGSDVKIFPDSLRPVMGDRVTVWILETGRPPYRLKSGEVTTHGRKRYFADCSRLTLGLAEYFDYNDAGQIVLRYSYPQPTMERIRAGSLGARIFFFACNADFRSRQVHWYNNPTGGDPPLPPEVPAEGG
jgi:hypothetical protein